MKRGREENSSAGPGPQSKRASSSSARAETSNQQPQRLTTDDALSYLKAVKDMFKDKKGKYDEFLEVMKDFKAQRINTSGVISRVKELFKGHRDLILGFNTFLPKGYEITLPPEDELIKKQPVEFNQAISYVNKIKTRFKYDEHTYKSFLEILNMYRKGNKTIGEVYQEVAALFREHHDLLEEFTYFLPDTSGVVNPLSKAPGNSLPRRDDKGYSWPGPKQAQLGKREKASTTHDYDRSSEKHTDHENHDCNGKLDKDQRKKDREMKEEREHEENDSDDEQHSVGMQHPMNKRKSARRADELIRRQTQFGERGEASGRLIDEKKVPRILQKKLGFFERVKARLGSPETYQEFLKCINMYTEEIICRKDLHNLVGDLLANSPDLIEGFNEFLTFCESNEGFLANTINKRLNDGPLIKPKSEREERDRERERDKDAGERKRDSEKDRERDKFSSQLGRDASNHKPSFAPNKDKYWAKPINELDLSNCERCTPSYRLLPKNYPKPVASLRSKWAHSVLNDKWVSVTSGSEDYSFKHMRKNQYEESLFRCEDDRFELDMLLETTAVTTQRMEELLQKLQEVNCKQNSQVQMGDYLKAIHFRCIERIYGDHGFDVIDLLRKNVPVALPVILNRLKQKLEEWSKCRSDMNKVWAEVYAKNYHKSLDHRSFYFKQQDKKSLSTKALLAEIKEINGRKQRDDDVILSAAAGNANPYSPDLIFECYDKDIYDDLYQIIKYSADEICSSMEQSDKIMRLWTTFLEPFFGVPTRPQGTEDMEEVVKVKPSRVKNNGQSNNGNHVSTANGRITDRKHQSSRDSASPVEETPKLSKTESAKVVRTTANKAILDPKAGNPGSRSPANISGLPEYSDDGERSAETRLPSERSPVQVQADLHGPLIEKEPEGRRENELPELKNDIDGSKTSYSDVPLDTSGKVEREEGELSPSPEAEERHANNTSGDCTLAAKTLENNASNHLEENQGREDEDMEYDGEAEIEHCADVYDEGEGSALKPGEDSENASEPGDDISGTESGDGDDSPDDREDEEDEDEQQHGENECEGEAEVVVDGEEDGTSLTSWDRLLLSCMPLTTRGLSPAAKSAFDGTSRVFYGNDTLYVLFRLHQTLYERILSAKTNAKAAEQKWKPSKDLTSPDLYEKFMRALYDLLDGSADNVKFEDDCRSIIGTQSYVLFTLDKLIYKLVKQLQEVVSDDTANKLLSLHSYEKSRPTGRFMDGIYYANACVLLHDENIYKFEHVSNSQLCIQLMEERSPEKLELSANAIDHKFSKYLDNFLLEAGNTAKEERVFLARNKHYYTKEGEDGAFTRAMKNVVVANGLEYKISCNTSKVSYVLDTRDIFFRRNRKRKASGDWRFQKFNRWLSCMP